MKCSLLNRFVPLVLLALLNVFSSAASSQSAEVSNLDPRDYDYLQADQNTQALFFKEISVGNYFQLEPEKNSGSSGFSHGILQNLELHKKAQNDYSTWGYLPNFRDLLENQIFPFHFFW